MTQYSVSNMVAALDDPGLLQLIKDRIAALPHLPESERFTFEAYCSYQEGAEMGPFYHHLECKKRYEPDATDVAQGIDCPYCHPDIYIEEEARQSRPQAKMKTGITEQPQGIFEISLRRYSCSSSYLQTRVPG